VGNVIIAYREIEHRADTDALAKPSSARLIAHGKVGVRCTTDMSSPKRRAANNVRWRIACRPP
jgi:hypothetical protein